MPLKRSGRIRSRPGRRRPHAGLSEKARQPIPQRCTPQDFGRTTERIPEQRQGTKRATRAMGSGHCRRKSGSERRQSRGSRALWRYPAREACHLGPASDVHSSSSRAGASEAIHPQTSRLLKSAWRHCIRLALRISCRFPVASCQGSPGGLTALFRLTAPGCPGVDSRRATRGGPSRFPIRPVRVRNMDVPHRPRGTEAPCGRPGTRDETAGTLGARANRRRDTQGVERSIPTTAILLSHGTSLKRPCDRVTR